MYLPQEPQEPQEPQPTTPTCPCFLLLLLLCLLLGDLNLGRRLHCLHLDGLLPCKCHRWPSLSPVRALKGPIYLGSWTGLAGRGAKRGLPSPGYRHRVAATPLSTLTHLLEIVPFLLEAPGALGPNFSLLWSVLLAEEEIKSSSQPAMAPSSQHPFLMASWTNPAYLPRVSSR